MILEKKRKEREDKKAERGQKKQKKSSMSLRNSTKTWNTTLTKRLEEEKAVAEQRVRALSSGMSVGPLKPTGFTIH